MLVGWVDSESYRNATDVSGVLQIIQEANRFLFFFSSLVVYREDSNGMSFLYYHQNVWRNWDMWEIQSYIVPKFQVNPLIPPSTAM